MALQPSPPPQTVRADIFFIFSGSPAMALPPGMMTALAPAMAARLTISGVMSGFRL